MGVDDRERRATCWFQDLPGDLPATCWPSLQRLPAHLPILEERPPARQACKSRGQPLWRSLATVLISVATQLEGMTELAVAGALADAEGCARLLASFGFKSKFLPYLVIRKLQSISLAIGPLRLVGWGAQKVAGKLAGAEGPFTQTDLENALVDILPHCRRIIAAHLPGWERVFGYTDCQHVCCEMRKFLDAGYARQRHPADARSQREWKELVQDFARANGLPSPEAALQHSECDSSTPHLSDSQNAFLDFLDALVVRFITAWLCGQRPLRQTAYRFLEHDDWSYKKIGQFSYHLDRSSLLQWKYALQHACPGAAVWCWPPAGVTVAPLAAQTRCKDLLLSA
ncbi:unnamed protein product, partial [Effrenium voratum]